MKSLVIRLATMAMAVCITATGLGVASAHAATISVVAGTDALAENGQCQFSEAMQNINDQAQTNADCAAGDGANDTVQLPAGTITLSASSYLENNFGFAPSIVGSTKDVKILGQSRSQSIINGASTYGILVGNADSAEFRSFTFTNAAAQGGGIGVTNVVNTVVDDIEVTQGTCTFYPLFIGDMVATNTSVTLNNIYIHNFSCADLGSGPTFGIVLDNTYGGRMALSATNITVSNIQNVTAAVGLVAGSNIQSQLSDQNASGEIVGEWQNITVSDIDSDQVVGAIGFQQSNFSSDNNVSTHTIKNVTMRNISSDDGGLQIPDGPFVEAAAIGVRGGSFGSGSLVVNVQVQNMVGANSMQNGASRVCSLFDFNNTATINMTSAGGNVYDDTSCSSVFTQPTDKQNQTALKNYLGTLGSNGGSVPTIPLLPGAVAIDGGVCDNAPSEDARGITRPQGRTCDSGAFELEQDTIASTSGIATATGTAKAYIEAAPGVAVTESSPVPVSVADGSNSYPLGLVSFTLAVPTASTQTVNVDFETNLALDSVTVRKFKSATQAYSDIPGVTLTEGTRNNKRVVRATYQITDGGALDADGQANGAIVDPVGLALKPTIPRVGGILLGIGGPLMLTMVALASYIIFDWRRHLKPLLAEDPTVRYTLWHHLRVVSIPLFQYRFSVVVSQRDT